MRASIVLALSAIYLTWGQAVAAPPSVAADILPVHSLVSSVTIGVTEPALIVAPGASPHHHALRPSEAQKLQQAEVIFSIGEVLTPWLFRAIASLPGDRRVVELPEVEGTIVLMARAGRRQIAGGRVATPDPHFWLDPANAVVWLEAIATVLAEADPENAARYAANAEAEAARIATLATAAQDRLRQPRQQAVFHDAYQYFEARFGLPAPVIIARSDAAPAGAARLREVRRQLLDAGVPCLFAEPGSSAPLAARLLEGTATRVKTVDPVGASIAAGPDHYRRLIMEIAEANADCAR